MKKIKILEINEVDLIGKVFNGYNFIEDVSENQIDVKQAVVVKYSNNHKVIEILNDDNQLNLFFRLQNLEKKLSVHNLFSITSPALYRLNEFIEADIIHFHMFHNSKLSLASLSNISKIKKVIITLHDPWFLTGRCVHFYNCNKWKNGCINCEYLNTLFPFDEDKCNFMWNMKKEIFMNSNIDIVVTSKWMLNCIKKSSFFNNNSKIHFIPLGVNLEIFKENPQKNAKKKFGINNNNIVLFLRAQKEFKGAVYINDALKKLKIDRKITILTCDQKNLFNNLSSKYKIIDLGQIDEMKMVDAMNACDIFLMPSKAESFGMMAIEAMACVKPVIVFDNTALPTITFAPGCGYLVKDRDSISLMRAIKYLISNQSEREKRGKLGREFCEKFYGYDLYINNIKNLYKQIYKQECNQKIYNNKKTVNQANLNNLKSYVDNYLQKNISVPINLNNIGIEEYNAVNSYIYEKYVLENNKFKKALNIRIKKVLKKSKIICYIYNKSKTLLNKVKK